jgi:hypothetical protein
MGKSSSEQRKHARLPGQGSAAKKFSGDKSPRLPAQATVADISEGGVGLHFDWPAGKDFPASSGDGLGFHLAVEGSDRVFEVLSTVRHVARDEDTGGVKVGVEFWGLPAEIREGLKNALLNLAVTALRTWRGGAGEMPVRVPASRKTAAASAAEAVAPAVPGAGKRRKLYLGEVLVKQGVLDGERLERFLTTEFSGRQRLGKELADRGLIDDAALAKALAEQARMPYLDLDKQPPDAGLAAKLPRQVFTKHWAIPVREEAGALLVAMASPPELPVFEQLRDAAGRRLRVGIAAEDRLAVWLKRLYHLEGAPRPAQMRFPVHMHVEYRFLTSDWKSAVDRRPTVGLTREASRQNVVIAGPLPEGLTPERIAAENLCVAVKADCPELRMPVTIGCRPEKVTRSEYADEYHLDCRIEKFPRDGEMAWARLCMLRGTVRFRPEARGS